MGLRWWRRLHLLLGCVFAPLLLFFALSGLWQLQGWDEMKGPVGKILTSLSTIHHGRGTKIPGVINLSSPTLRLLTVAMVASFVLNIVSGLIMAYRSAPAWIVSLCLLLGVAVPVTMAWLVVR